MARVLGVSKTTIRTYHEGDQRWSAGHKKLLNGSNVILGSNVPCYSPKPVENVEKLHTFEEKVDMMIPEILVACETPTSSIGLNWHRQYPPVWEPSSSPVGNPDWVVTGSYFGWKNDVNWKDFPMPNQEHSIWAFDGSGMNTQIRGVL